MKEYISTAEGMEQMWDKINEVIDGFGFASVAAVMKALDWTWVCTKEEAELYKEEGCFVKWDRLFEDVNESADGYYSYRPEYPQLMSHTRKLIVSAIKDMPDDKTHWSYSTGGFKVEIWISTDEEREEAFNGSQDWPPADDFKHSVDIGLYFIPEEYTTF